MQDPVLYNEFKLEVFKENGEKQPPKRTRSKPVAAPAPKKKKPPSAFRLMQSVLKLPDDHEAVKYLRDERKIPSSMWKYFFYVEKYYSWIHKVKPSEDRERAKYLQEKREHSRLIIPYFDKDYNIFRITARSFSEENSPKYLFTVIDDEKPSLYNYDFIDRDKRVYVVEGQIDSLFLPNCIAVGNANYGVPELRQLHDKVIVPDNQPRNPEVVKNIKAAVDMGYPICIWDKVYGKDLNDMFKSGYSLEEIKQIIDRNTYQGAAAQLKFSQWKRC
jgi:hypothetical protein